MKLCIHFQTSTVAPLKFGNEYVISSHTLQWVLLLSMLRLKINYVSKRGYQTYQAVSGQYGVIASPGCIPPCRVLLLWRATSSPFNNWFLSSGEAWFRISVASPTSSLRMAETQLSRAPFSVSPSIVSFSMLHTRHNTPQPPVDVAMQRFRQVDHW